MNGGGAVRGTYGVRRVAIPSTFLCRAEGDSLTFNGTYLSLAQYFAALLQPVLQGLGCALAVVNAGVSGRTTAGILVAARLAPTVRSGAFANIFGGTNDLNHQTTVQASPSPTTTVFAVGAGVGQFFLANTSMLINGVSRAILSVSTDTITLASALPDPPVAGQTAVIDTVQNLIDIGLAMKALGYTRLLIGTHPYLNYTTGGDTLAAQQSLALTTRTAQNAAYASLASSSGAVLVDFYTWMRSLIVAGTVTQGSFSWHVADGNVHLNAYGEQILCDCLAAAIPQAWIDALQA